MLWIFLVVHIVGKVVSEATFSAKYSNMNSSHPTKSNSKDALKTSKKTLMHVWKTRRWNFLRLVSVTNEVLLILDCNLQTKNVLINKQGWHHNCEYVRTKPILICFHVSGLEKKEVLIKQMKHFSWQFFQPHEIKITTIITAVKNSLRNVILLKLLKLLRTYWFHEVTLLQLYHLTSTSKHTFTWTPLLTFVLVPPAYITLLKCNKNIIMH